MSIKNFLGSIIKQVNIDLSDSGLLINNELLLEFSVSRLTEALGKPRITLITDENSPYSAMYLWDSLGIYAFEKKDGTLATLACRVAEDKDWQRTVTFDYFALRPKGLFTGNFTIAGKSPLSYISKERCTDPFGLDVALDSWNVSCLYTEKLSNDLEDLSMKAIMRRVAQEAMPFRDYEVSYIPNEVDSSKEKDPSKWAFPLTEEKCVQFKSFNFKLAVVQELMYVQEVLRPKFDVYDFCENYTERDIDPEDYYFEVIPEVKKWFMDLPIPTSLAALVTELYFDGGNEIYAQLIPFWDGEDDVFDIESLTEEDISQVPNLKTIDGTAILMSEQVKNLCKSKGIVFVE
nr:hypothetical protein [uncultured Capnocytophaga sp.]